MSVSRIIEQQSTLCVTRDIHQRFLELPHSLQIHVKLNLQLRNHLKIKSVAALPHSVRWSNISYSATSITTHKLDHLQATNSCPWPYKDRILIFSTKRPHELSLQC
nr:MAG TPA: hypothetical protein [Bacteriophage sp.]